MTDASSGHQFHNFELFKQFVLAGRAQFQLINPQRKTKLFYVVKRAKENGSNGRPWFVGSADHNFNEVQFFAIMVEHVRKDGTMFHTCEITKRGRPLIERDFVRTWFWLWQQQQAAMDKIEVWHTGKCGRCGRLLTDTVSVARGIGPECVTKGQ